MYVAYEQRWLSYIRINRCDLDLRCLLIVQKCFDYLLLNSTGAAHFILCKSFTSNSKNRYVIVCR